MADLPKSMKTARAYWSLLPTLLAYAIGSFVGHMSSQRTVVCVLPIGSAVQCVPPTDTLPIPKPTPASYRVVEARNDYTLWTNPDCITGFHPTERVFPCDQSLHKIAWHYRSRNVPPGLVEYCEGTKERQDCYIAESQRDWEKLK